MDSKDTQNESGASDKPEEMPTQTSSYYPIEIDDVRPAPMTDDSTDPKTTFYPTGSKRQFNKKLHIFRGKNKGRIHGMGSMLSREEHKEPKYTDLPNEDQILIKPGYQGRRSASEISAAINCTLVQPSDLENRLAETLDETIKKE